MSGQTIRRVETLDYNSLIGKDFHHTKKQLIHLKEALEVYQNHYKNRKIKIRLNNGENVYINLKYENLPHLLGFNRYNPVYEQIFELFNLDRRKMSLYELMNYLVSNIDINARKMCSVDEQFLKKVGLRSFLFIQCGNLLIPNYVICDRRNSKIGSIKSNYFIINDCNFDSHDYVGMGLFNSKDKDYVETLIKIRQKDHIIKDNAVLLPTKIIGNDGKFISVSTEIQIKLLKNYANFIRCNNLTLLTEEREIKGLASKMKIKVY